MGSPDRPTHRWAEEFGLVCDPPLLGLEQGTFEQPKFTLWQVNLHIDYLEGRPCG